MDLHTNAPVNKIDQVVKSYKMHWKAIDFDLSFINLVVNNKDAT